MANSVHITYRPLYTLLVRDEFGSWVPVAHFFTKLLEAGIIVDCLQKIRSWCGEEGGWNLRYFLTDDSAAEQKGFHEAFKGIEPPVKCLLCSVHSRRTLQLNLGKSPALDHMVAALRARRTKAGCMESIQAAMEAANDKDRRYIERNWKDCTALWARYARDSVPLLAQVCTMHLPSYLFNLLCNIDFYTAGLNDKCGRVLAPEIKDGRQGRDAQELLNSGLPISGHSVL